VPLTFDDLHARVEVLETLVRGLRVELRAIDERLDTVCSPPWKRAWWFLKGYRWYRVGRWR
jgi:hypothetical protein